MKAILAIIMAAIGLYIGINLLPGLNTTVSTITTPTYSSGVAGMVGVVREIIATLNSNVHRITLQIRGSLNSFMSMVITELSRKCKTSRHVERLDGASPLKMGIMV